MGREMVEVVATTSPRTTVAARPPVGWLLWWRGGLPQPSPYATLVACRAGWHEGGCGSNFYCFSPH